eukprot:TRINITY_DN10737_c0_g1_i2.p1 TRINITY_DN10737_c0_g1~~TRINITY_DN10737_c0_g1_i2.p1  ORF type:complete len:274 (+),score=61.01 TRINITY_DN10737_c0_g1_i2:30-824(+)
MEGMMGPMGTIGNKCPPLWSNGPDFQSIYSFPNRKSVAGSGPRKVTQSPVTTGTSTFAMKFDGGVILAADTLGSYGSMAMFTDLQRVMKVNDQTCVVAGGDIADFQFLQSVIEQKQIDEDCRDDGLSLKPAALHSWLTRVMYNRRSKFDPLWNIYLVGGMQDGEPFLGYVNLQGTAFTETLIASGLGGEMAVPVMRKAMEVKGGLLNEQEARETITKCVRLGYLRDCRAWPKYHIATITKDGVKIDGPLMIDSDWEYAKGIEGY